jgi:hypothetical protein
MQNSLTMLSFKPEMGTCIFGEHMAGRNTAEPSVSGSETVGQHEHPESDPVLPVRESRWHASAEFFVMRVGPLSVVS